MRKRARTIRCPPDGTSPTPSWMPLPNSPARNAVPSTTRAPASNSPRPHPNLVPRQGNPAGVGPSTRTTSQARRGPCGRGPIHRSLPPPAHTPSQTERCRVRRRATHPVRLRVRLGAVRRSPARCRAVPTSAHSVQARCVAPRRHGAALE